MHDAVTNQDMPQKLKSVVLERLTTADFPMQPAVELKCTIHAIRCATIILWKRVVKR